jgi:hypothetical protein
MGHRRIDGDHQIEVLNQRSGICEIGDFVHPVNERSLTDGVSALLGVIRLLQTDPMDF